METVRLPKNLGEFALVALNDLNKKLHAQKIRLDWRDVRSPLSHDQLTALLAGLNISDHEDLIGVETIPPFLQKAVLAVSDAQKREPPRQKEQPAVKPQGATPRRWSPAGEDVDLDTTEIKKIRAPQNTKDLVSQDENVPVPAHPGPGKPLDAPTNFRLHDLPAGLVLPDLPQPSSDKQAPVQGAHLISRLASSDVQTVPAIADLALDMHDLAETDAAALPTRLFPLINMYLSWISAHEARLSSASLTAHEARRGEAVAVLQQCRKTLTRIEAGITLLAHCHEAAQAFAFMNRAMWLQRIHTLYAEKKQDNSAIQVRDVDLPEYRRWRPLQLAFILLNLPMLTNVPSHRSVYNSGNVRVNLPWFLIGEGKVEAYLGLSAYTLALRRLQHADEGSAVIMCYPPRQSAVQQSQHISALVAACEMIRSTAQSTWGTHPFQLGVWEGSRSASDDDTTRVFRAGRRFPRGGSFAMLTWCPWCGSDIEKEKERMATSYNLGWNRTLIPCSDPLHLCPFCKPQTWGTGLIFVMNEEIHRTPPPLLITTTDEIAGLPWKDGTQIHFM